MKPLPSFWRDRLQWWHLLLGLLLLRLLYLPLFCSVTDLAGDESYYWEWGRRPDWGYYSKPPMIGWLMGISGWLAGHQEWAVRLSALLFGTASLAALAALARVMFGQNAARLTLLFAALTPANAALNLFFTIDAPLVLFWSASLLWFWLAMQQPQRVVFWLLLLVTLGLGHLSKQMMLVFPLLMLLFVLLQRGSRSLLRHPWFWICLGGSLLFMLPVLWWNHEHGWITVQHTREHFGTAAAESWLKRLGEMLLFPLTQAALLTPLTWLLMMALLGHQLWKWHEMGPRRRYLTLFSAPGLLVFFWLSTRQDINPNWPAVFYLSGMVMLGAAADRPSLWRLGGWAQPLVKPAIGVGVALTALACLAPVASSFVPALAPFDPLYRLRGWREAGWQLGELLQATPRPGQTFVIALGHRENASQFAFYTPQHPQMYRWEHDGRIASQYELWPSAKERKGDDALILQPPEKKLPGKIVRAFKKVTPHGEVQVALPGRQSRTWKVWLGTHLQDWPEAKGVLASQQNAVRK